MPLFCRQRQTTHAKLINTFRSLLRPAAKVAVIVAFCCANGPGEGIECDTVMEVVMNDERATKSYHQTSAAPLGERLPC